MKRNRSKRILATILCMVMVLTSNISALAEGEVLQQNAVETGTEGLEATPATVSEAPEEPAPEQPQEPASETPQGSVPEQPTSGTPEQPASETQSGTPEQPTPGTQSETPEQPTPGIQSETPEQPTPGTQSGTPEQQTSGTSSTPEGSTPGTSSETTPQTESKDPSETPKGETPEGEKTEEETPEEEKPEEPVFSEATELHQDFKDASGKLIQRIKAKLPAGAFEAETSQITMEVSYVDSDMEKYVAGMMEEKLPEGNVLGDYILYKIEFKVNGEVRDSLEPITITFEKSGLEITDTKKANVFYFNPKNEEEGRAKDELVEITQRNEMLEYLQSSGQSTADIEDYDLSSIEMKEENLSGKITLEGRTSTIYGCYVEKEEKPEENKEETPEEKPEALELTFEDEQIEVKVSAEEVGIIPEGATLKVVPITAENETKEQYEEVAKQIQEKVAEEEKEVAGFLAYDISFVDEDGKEVEPNGKVKVSMNYKKAELPKEVEENKATDAEVTVLHLEENEKGEVKQVVDMAAEQKATVDTLTTTEGAKVQNVEVETESFSVFTITWIYDRYSKLEVTCQYATMDAEGNIEEITVENLPENIEIDNNQEIQLTQYNQNIKGYTFRNAIIQVKNFMWIKNVEVTALKASITGSWSSKTYKIQYKDQNGYQDWLSSSWNGTKNGTVYFIYDKLDSQIQIEDHIIDDGSLTAVLSDEITSENVTYEWSKADTKDGEYTVVKQVNFKNGASTLSEDGTKLYPAYDKGARKWYKVKVVYEDGTEEESEPFQVPYYDELQNGGFEDVLVYNNERVTNAYYKAQGGVWQSTKGGRENDDQEDKHIEILVTETGADKEALKNNFAWDARLSVEDAESEDGTVRFAEINCSAAGALYQDVLTINDQALNYWLSHRARGTNNDKKEHDEMYLVIMPTKVAVDNKLNDQDNLNRYLRQLGIKLSSTAPGQEYEKVEYNGNGILVVRISSDDQNWHDVMGELGYTPTASLTRFFFMAGATASKSDTVGNFVDRVGFSQDLPKPEDGKFNFTIEKHFEGLGNAELTQLKDTIQFRISAKKNGKDLTDDEVKNLLGIDDVVIKGSDMNVGLDGTLTKSFADRPIGESNSVYEITVTEKNAELASYKVTSSYTTEVSQNSGALETANGEGAIATVSDIKGKTEATISFTNTYEATNYKNVNFTKVWDDKDNDFGTRPDSLDVTLHGSVSYVDANNQTVTKELTAEELGVEVTKTLNDAGQWKTSWKVPTYYEVAKADGTTAKIKIRYTVTEGTINSAYAYEAGQIQSGNGEDYQEDSFEDVTITGDGEAVTQPAAIKTFSMGRSLMALPGANENTLGEPNHRKYITYNEATGDYTLNLDVTGKKGEAKGVDVLFVIDTSGSMGDNGLLWNVKKLLTKDGGVVDKIFSGENNVNSVAYVSFAGKSETKTSSWYGKNSKESFISKVNSLRATGGTNWTYAMMKASEKLAERANSGNEKVMIFLSDGEPTYSINEDGRQYGKGSSSSDAYYREAINKVKDSASLTSAQKYSVYLTWGTQSGMSRFATGTGAELVDGTELGTALEGILNKIIPTYEDVSITDTLTDYVEFSEGATPTVTVYKNNTVLDRNAYRLITDGKTVRVSFNDDLEDGSTYRISFRVKPSQKANEEFSRSGYLHQGEAGTGTTSAGKEGFYSNTEATLTYSVKGTEDKNLKARYNKPVVQVTTHSLTFEKKWSKPKDVSTPSKVTLNVAYTDGTSETITLSKNNGWTVTKNNVPVTKKIQSVTEAALNDYTPSYEISGDGTKATVTNSYSKITTKNMTVKKTWSGNGPQPEVTVSLYQRRNEDNAEKLYSSEVLNEKNGWTCSWENLPSENWQEGSTFSYAVREEKIPENYTSNITYETSGDTTFVNINNVYDENCADENFYIANKLQTIPLTVTKTWSDGNNAQGERPESLGVTVKDGKHTLRFTLSAKDNWTKNVEVPKRNDGAYSATENLNGITNYTQIDSSVNATDNAVYVSFTNQIQTKSITVNKVWVDGDPSNRPGSINFVLKRDGKVYDYYTLSAEDKDEAGKAWTKVIEDLPITGDYTVEETGYGSSTTYDYNSEVNGFTITNTLNWHIIKTSESLAGEDTVVLEGAKFELKQDDDIIATGTSDGQGIVQWTGNTDLTSLDGEYQLVETKAPNGYVVHEQGWKLTFENGILKTVTDNKNNKETAATYDAEKGACVTVTNTKLYELPETGGTGIFVYTIGGTLLLMAAALLIYKMKREEVLKG